ncbi:MAG: alpha/beta fold hydrolase [Marinibacterium sp.]
MTGIIPGFEAGRQEVNGQTIAFSHAGSGPPVLLLHGFPQNRAMWRDIAPALARENTIIAADLRGYGDSIRATDTPMTFRAMASDQVALMAGLGFTRFHVVGHDRGARTAHRMALDHPDAILSLTLMDIVPTHHLLSNLTREVAASYYHWTFLAQPAPFPETLIAADPDFFFERCLQGFGRATLADFPPEALAAYRSAWRRPEVIAAMCADYRAALTEDFDMDAADLTRRVACPSLVLGGAKGVMAHHFDIPATWKDRLTDIRAAAIPGGHFFPEQAPGDTTRELIDFLHSLS